MIKLFQHGLGMRTRKRLWRGFGTWNDLQVGSNVQVDIYYPGSISKQLPVLVWCHGGGFVGGSRKMPSAKSFCERLAHDEDFPMVIMAVGYSKHIEDVVLGQIQNVCEALLFARDTADKFGGDSGKIFLGGHSAGAYLALKTGLNNPGLTQGLIGVSGIYNLKRAADLLGFQMKLNWKAVEVIQSESLRRFPREILLLQAQNELPLLKADNLELWKSPRQSRCVLEEVQETNHFQITLNKTTQSFVREFIRNGLKHYQS